MSLDLDYQRAAEAALAADKAAADAHAALFDFARQLGDLSTQVQARSAPLPLHVRFVRRAPPNLAAPAGVRVDEAPKERPAGFASVVIEARDLFFAVESLPGIAVAAVTNVPGLEAYAAIDLRHPGGERQRSAPARQGGGRGRRRAGRAHRGRTARSVPRIRSGRLHRARGVQSAPRRADRASTVHTKSLP